LKIIHKIPTTTNVPHSGQVTHHHDQFITPHNFSTKNTINVAPQMPMSPELDEDELLILGLLKIIVSVLKNI